MENHVAPGKTCQRCGQSISEEEHKRGSLKYCLRCSIEIAEQKIPAPVSPWPTLPRKKKAAVAVIQWILLIGFSVAIIVNSVVLIKLYLRERPREAVVPDLPISAEICRSNLTDLSRLLASGKLPSDSTVCPASGLSYKVTILSGDTVVSCPTPEKHGLKALRVSSRNPAPEVLQ